LDEAKRGLIAKFLKEFKKSQLCFPFGEDLEKEGEKK